MLIILLYSAFFSNIEHLENSCSCFDYYDNIPVISYDVFSISCNSYFYCCLELHTELLFTNKNIICFLLSYNN